MYDLFKAECRDFSVCQIWCFSAVKQFPVEWHISHHLWMGFPTSHKRPADTNKTRPLKQEDKTWTERAYHDWRHPLEMVPHVCVSVSNSFVDQRYHDGRVDLQYLLRGPKIRTLCDWADTDCCPNGCNMRLVDCGKYESYSEQRRSRSGRPRLWRSGFFLSYDSVEYLPELLLLRTNSTQFRVVLVLR